MFIYILVLHAHYMKETKIILKMDQEKYVPTENPSLNWKRKERRQRKTLKWVPKECVWVLRTTNYTSKK